MTVKAQPNAPYHPLHPFQQIWQSNTETSDEVALQNFQQQCRLHASLTYFTPTIRSKDAQGGSHQRYQQFYHGLRVVFGTAIVHQRPQHPTFVNGEVYRIAEELTNQPTRTAAEAFDAALLALHAQKFSWELPAFAKRFPKPKGELLWLPLIHKGTVVLAYEFDIYALAPWFHDKVYIDAHTGALLLRLPQLVHHQAEGVCREALLPTPTVSTAEVKPVNTTLQMGQAATRYHGVQTIWTSYQEGQYVLQDNFTVGGVSTFNCQGGADLTDVYFTDNDNFWSQAEFNNAAKDNAALDAHWGAEVTLRFWSNFFNRSSYDDQGTLLQNYVHFDPSPGDQVGYNNAFWDGAEMVYGDGSSFQPLTSLDVCGHEIGHGVCQATANLAYMNQSGAINEALSDIWGACIEQYGESGQLHAPADTAYPGQQGVWRVGEDIHPTDCLRSMSYPNFKSDADTFLGDYYIATADDMGCDPDDIPDYCGVHSNSGVVNHWFYMVSVGKSGVNNAPASMGGPVAYEVSGIGMDKAAQITFAAERDYLTPNATFMDLRYATIQAVYALYCHSGPELETVIKAWKAVNVGDAYVPYTHDIGIRQVDLHISPYCDTTHSARVWIDNNGLDALPSFQWQYQWDNGLTHTATVNSVLPTCGAMQLSLEVPDDFSFGTHQLRVWVLLANDQNPSNNSTTITFSTNKTAPVGQLYTFENSDNDLITIDDRGQLSEVWERGVINKTLLTSSLAGSKVYATQLTGNYPDATKAYLLSPCYSLTQSSQPTLHFDLAFDLEENFDVLYLEYSLDYGAHWQLLGSAGPNWYNSAISNCTHCVGGQWTGAFNTAPEGGNGQNGHKRHYSLPLSFLNAPSHIIFRFVFHSDTSLNLEGAMVDNWVIQEAMDSRQSIQSTGLILWPNPAQTHFLLGTHELISGAEAEVKVYDAQGRLVYRQQRPSDCTQLPWEIACDQWAAGVYWVQLQQGQAKWVQRLIIRR